MPAPMELRTSDAQTPGRGLGLYSIADVRYRKL
jgi:hypothetical protein